MDAVTGAVQGGKGMTHQELLNESDMLEGNINRMMVTDDIKELREMYDWACKRLAKIYTVRFEELDNGEKE